MKKILLIVFAIFLFVALCSNAFAAEHEFVGAQKCGICHKTPEQGEQLSIWKNTKHAHAIEALATLEAKEIGAKWGVDDPQTSGKCLKCHSTAYYFTENRVTETIPVEENISCESCHGPGKDYMKKSIMEDKNAAVEAGLIIPDEKTCHQCHNQESPTYKPFDFKERYEKIKHPIPKK